MFGFLGAIIASGTALWIAYYVYPVQKKQDRALKLQEEKAAVYRTFFDAANDYYEFLKDGWRRRNTDGFDAGYQKLLKAQEALLLYAPANVVGVCKAFTQALFEYRSHVRAELNNVRPVKQMKSTSRGNAYHLAEEARDNALVKVRVDLWGCAEGDARDAVAGLRPKDETADERD